MRLHIKIFFLGQKLRFYTMGPRGPTLGIYVGKNSLGVRGLISKYDPN